jgi:hypothetical protein
MASESGNPHLRRSLLEAVENQVSAGTPPEARDTLARLQSQGHSREEATRLIACVLASEIFDVLKNKEGYNEARYIAGLRGLPRLPWETEEPDRPPRT